MVDYGVNRGTGWLARSRRVSAATAIAGTGFATAFAAVSAVSAVSVWAVEVGAAAMATEGQARRGEVGAVGAIAADVKKACPAACRPSAAVALEWKWPALWWTVNVVGLEGNEREKSAAI